MNKGRKTTQEERAEIVAFCIENNKNYTLTVEKYNISYQQIYSWVRKYEINGVEGLIDHRGKSKNKKTLQKLIVFVWRTRYYKQSLKIRKWKLNC